jgi:hypothetical protein
MWNSCVAQSMTLSPRVQVVQTVQPLLHLPGVRGEELPEDVLNGALNVLNRTRCTPGFHIALESLAVQLWNPGSMVPTVPEGIVVPIGQNPVM